MTYRSAPTLRVLHALRLKWVADANAVAAATALPPAAVDTELGTLANDGLVEQRTGRVAGWRLTDEGKATHRKRLQEELEESGTRAAIDGAYRRFLSFNKELLSLCTAWQMREGPAGDAVLNDHSDDAYDGSVIERLDAVHEGITPVAADLSRAIDRYEPYRTRLGHARERVKQGHLDWLTRPLIDSYHTVWFELHEDLLVTLGIERKEGEH